MTQTLWRALVAVLVVDASSCCLPLTAADVFCDVTLSRGAVHSGRIIEWNAESLKILGQELHTLPMHEIAVVEFPAQPPSFTAGTYVVQSHGDRYAISSLRCADEEFGATWAAAALRPRLSFPLETVAGILFDLPPAKDVIYAQLARLSRTPHGRDTARLLTGDDLPGELIGIEGGLVEFDAPLGKSKLDQRRLQSLALDPELAAAAALPASRWVVVFRDGSRGTVKRLVSRDDFSLHLTPLTGDPYFVPWHAVSRLFQFTPRWRPLSARAPAEVVHTPYLSGTATMERDVNIARRPLSLRGREYVTGLGMTSRMAATYGIEREDEAFRAVVGIDDHSAGLGSATFHCDVDGENVWSSPEIDGAQGPLATPLIPLRGHRRMTLRVEFGKSGDIGDFADWCDAVILQTPPGD